jgi:hypothetical protein
MVRKGRRAESQIRVKNLANALTETPALRRSIDSTVLELQRLMEDPQRLNLVFPAVSFAAPEEFGYSTPSMEGRVAAFLSAERIEIGLEDQEIRDTDLWADDFTRASLPRQISSAEGIATGLRALYLLGQHAVQILDQNFSEKSAHELAAIFTRILALGRLLLPIAIASSSGHLHPDASEWSGKFIQLVERLDTCNAELSIELS